MTGLEAFLFKAFLLYVVLPVGLCTVVGIFAGHSNPGVQSWQSGIVGTFIGIFAMIVNFASLLIIPSDAPLSAFVFWAIMTAVAAAVLTGYVSRRMNSE